jgi:hypothetical protein
LTYSQTNNPWKMENYQKIEKIGEGKFLGLLCLTFSERPRKTKLNPRTIATPEEP